jgi:heterodisulfide reductase subunit A-like polyferredoxin
MKIYFSNISIIEREIGKVYNDYYTNSIKTEKVKKIEDIIKQLEGLFETKIIELTPTFVSTVEEDIKSLY